MNTITAGTVIKSTWGYDQTNVDFYQVTKVQNGFAYLQPIGQEIVEQTGYLAERVVPNFVPCGKVMRRKVRNYGADDYVGISDYASGSVWNGTPVTQTHTH